MKSIHLDLYFITDIQGEAQKKLTQNDMKSFSWLEGPHCCARAGERERERVPHKLHTSK